MVIPKGWHQTMLNVLAKIYNQGPGGSAGGASEITAAATLTELQLKANLTETQPVSDSISQTALAAIVVALTGSVRTPSTLRVSGAGAATVAAGARAVVITNTGLTDATVLGDVLHSGEFLTWTTSGQDTLSAIAYNALTSELLITKVI